MYRVVNDFLTDWSNATSGTLQVLEAITDETLDQAIVEGHNSLGWLGWHLAVTPIFFGGLIGLNVKKVDNATEVPKYASEIVALYKQVVGDFKQQVEANVTDEQLAETVESFGQQVPRGALLRSLIDHQTHHRGQMTVLLRQAGLPVPGIMGPTKEQS